MDLFVYLFVAKNMIYTHMKIPKFSFSRIVNFECENEFIDTS